MKKKVAIIGAGTHAIMLKELITNEGFKFVGYFDENKKKNINERVLGNLNDLKLFKDKLDLILLGIGDNYKRALIYKKLKKEDYKFLTFIHSSVTICKSAQIGEGSVILMGSIVNSNALVKEACIINSGSIIEHDCYIDFSTHICPGSYLAGNVKVGKFSFIGLGTRIIQNVKIVDKVVVGAGSIILKNIKKACTVKGVHH